VVEKQEIEAVLNRTNARTKGLRAFPARMIALAVIAGPLVASAETPLASFAGEYKYASSRDHGVAIVDKALDPALADTNIVMRTLIRKGFSDNFAETIVIKTPAGKIGIKTGTLPEALTEIGKSTTMTSKDGKMSVKVTHEFDGSKLTEVSVNEYGKTTTEFELDDGGKTLHRRVSFKGTQFAKPVRYKLDYKRK
jgi:hypothetical protein